MYSKETVVDDNTIFTEAIPYFFPDAQIETFIVHRHFCPQWVHPFYIALVPDPYADKFFGRAIGSAFWDTNLGFIRKDLPERIRNVTELHEMYHLQDKNLNSNTLYGRFKSEVLANAHTLTQDFIGTIGCVVFDIAMPWRRQFYIDRFKTGDKIKG